jgi:hypothetical protein
MGCGSGAALYAKVFVTSCGTIKNRDNSRAASDAAPTGRQRAGLLQTAGGPHRGGAGPQAAALAEAVIPADEATTVWRRGWIRGSLRSTRLDCLWSDRQEHTQGTRALVTGHYEELNVFGTPTGTIEHALPVPSFAAGDIAPADFAV